MLPGITKLIGEVALWSVPQIVHGPGMYPITVLPLKSCVRILTCADELALTII